MRLPGRLQNGITQTKGQGQGRFSAPCILNVTLILICLEVTRYRSTIAKQRARSRTGEFIVIDVRYRRDRTDQVGILIDEVLVPPGIYCRSINALGIGRATTKPRRIAVGAIEGICIGGAVLMDQPPVHPKLDAVLALGDIEVVDDVIDR